MNIKDKILIIGQAPPAKKQKIPYDSTMLYEWLSLIGISKQKALEIFDFDAVYNEFPGYSSVGHKIPSLGQMEFYWNSSLSKKILNYDKIWILGNIAYFFLYQKKEIENKKIIHTMHPSMLNYSRFQKQKNLILDQIKEFLYV